MPAATLHLRLVLPAGASAARSASITHVGTNATTDLALIRLSCTCAQAHAVKHNRHGVRWHQQHPAQRSISVHVRMQIRNQLLSSTSIR